MEDDVRFTNQCRRLGLDESTVTSSQYIEVRNSNFLLL